MKMHNQLATPLVAATPLDSVDQVSLLWLKDVLTTAGYEFSDCITEVSIQGVEGNWSSNAQLRLHYANGRKAEWPSSLFLKTAGGIASPFGDTEVRYYLDIGSLGSEPPLPHCYHAAYSHESRRYHLLLEDLSSSHAPTWEKTWALEALDTLAGAFAHLHAPWWDHPSLPSVVAPYPDTQIITAYLHPCRRGLEPLLNVVSTRIRKEQQTLIELVYDKHPRLLEERARIGKHFTCVHGDTNPGNILFPTSPSGRCYLIDRQPFPWSLQTWLGASDLAYMMVHWWPSEARRAFEIPLLERYLQLLAEYGVQGYSWEELWNDYRLTALQSLYVVGQWCSEPSQMVEMEWVWWPQLQKCLIAFDDLQCEDLL